MWQNGILDLRYRNRIAVQSLLYDDTYLSEDDMVWYGYDPDVSYVEENELSQVVVNDVNFDEIDELNLVNPLRQSNLMGIDWFIEALEIARNVGP